MNWEVSVTKYLVRKIGNEYQGGYLRDIITNDVIQVGQYLRLEYKMENIPKGLGHKYIPHNRGCRGTLGRF